MTDFFYWTGDDDSTDEPRWMVEALADGRVTIENGGTAAVCLVIQCKRLKRGSIISRVRGTWRLRIPMVPAWLSAFAKLVGGPHRTYFFRSRSALAASMSATLVDDATDCVTQFC